MVDWQGVRRRHPCRWELKQSAWWCISPASSWSNAGASPRRSSPTWWKAAFGQSGLLYFLHGERHRLAGSEPLADDFGATVLDPTADIAVADDAPEAAGMFPGRRTYD